MRRVLIPCEDDSGNKLAITQSDDGDIFVSIIRDNGRGLSNSVRLCTSAGDGHYLKTRLNLQNVLNAALLEGCENQFI